MEKMTLKESTVEVWPKNA
jgi:hypothetical protein